MGSVSPKGYPYPDPPDANDVPADMEELVDVLDARPGVSAVTPGERDALVGSTELWDGRTVFNRTSRLLQAYDAAAGAWKNATITVHGMLSGLDEDDHPQYAKVIDAVLKTTAQTIAGIKTFTAETVFAAGLNTTGSGQLKELGQRVFSPNNPQLSAAYVTASSGSSLAINVTQNGTYNLTRTITLDANCTFTFTSLPTSGFECSVTLRLVQDATGSRTVTWPASVKWAAGAAPTLSTVAGRRDVITLFTVDGGTTWDGFVAGKAMA